MGLLKILGITLVISVVGGLAGWALSGESLVTAAALTRNPLFVKGAVWAFDPNEVDEDQIPPLVVGAHSGHRAIISILVDAGANPDLRGRDGRTPLVCAVIEDHPFVVRKLIAAGTDLNLLDHKGRSALIYAAKAGRDAVARDLLKNGADANLGDKAGNPALYYSIVTGNHGITRILVAEGAEIDRVNKRGDTPLMAALRYWEEHEPIALSLQRAAIGYLLEKGQRLSAMGSRGHSLEEMLEKREFKNLIPEEEATPG